MVKTFSLVCLALLSSFSFQGALMGIAAASERFYGDAATGESEGATPEADAESIKSTAAQAPPAPVLKNTGEAKTPGADSDGSRQKESCETHLKQLRELFLKTRQYATRRVPCKAAENGAAFLRVIETCRRDCPPQTLERSGYTARMVRYITSLQKIGEDRCRNDQEAAAPPAGDPSEPQVMPSAPQDPP
jgi:hypothetical protein